VFRTTPEAYGDYAESLSASCVPLGADVFVRDVERSVSTTTAEVMPIFAVSVCAAPVDVSWLLRLLLRHRAESLATQAWYVKYIVTASAGATALVKPGYLLGNLDFQKSQDRS
jgi:hypothetical protein